MLEPVANIKTADRGKLLTNKLFSQQSTIKMFNGKHRDLVDPYNVAVSKHISYLIASVEAL